jgi:hypothetical protein
MRRSWLPISMVIAAWICSACTSESVPPRREPVDRTPDDGPADDGSPPDDAPPAESCESVVIPTPSAPGCAAATDTCIQSCMDETCYYGCLDADPDPDGCGECLDDVYVSCANSMGCQASWDAMLCCTDEHCGEGVTEAACEAACGPELDAFDSCIDGAGAACSGGEGVCFP